MTYPTGEQYEIVSGEHRAVVTEVGATLRSYTVSGRHVVRGFEADEVVQKGRGQQLLPWPNRIRDGLYTFQGTEYQLDITEPKRYTALHGLARHVPWTLVEQTADSVTQTVRVYPQPGWPGILEATITHQVSDRGLQVNVRATNIGDVDFPFGYAAHPYLTVGETTVDDVSITVPAAAYLEVDDDRLLPIRVAPVEGTENDLRAGEPLGTTVLDTAFTDLTRGEDGRWRVRLSRGDRQAELWGDATMTWIQVFTGEEYRDLSLAIEPMTCGPDAFNEGPTHDGVIVLAPGKSYTGRWGLTGR
ncbi:MAG: Aldose 1-epimerase [uncultured Friedmanniella sp.]|uniref:Aldose 1-epimerase n=1 Tax=uncultured Friedmanniella sp. TaxID=335381 RepID=A0A6J4LJT5_9ACTN|nr:aldose 1-epimerase family protein [uncultured Friedmanniella sp.]CAA9334878.1 MAG: Aldose 1-epimerase [uncultured Friedmanniella sp.]